MLFIIKQDKQDKLRFVSQQSDIGIKLMKENGCSYNALKTIIFIKENKVSVKTDAIIEIEKLLNGYPKLIVFLKIIPPLIRDYCTMFSPKEDTVYLVKGIIVYCLQKKLEISLLTN